MKTLLPWHMPYAGICICVAGQSGHFCSIHLCHSMVFHQNKTKQKNELVQMENVVLKHIKPLIQGKYVVVSIDNLTAVA